MSHLATPRTEEELLATIQLLNDRKWPVFIIGSGTNLLVGDEGFSGLMIRPDFSFIEQNGNEIRVGAGVLMADLLAYALRENLGGMEWAGGLPGTVGGAVRGNAGCFGSETKDFILGVESINLQTGKKIVREKKDGEFEYRSSIFKTKLDGKEIITAATLTLFPQERKISEAVANEHIQYRKDRQPLEYPNIGSIFKNVDARNFTEEKLKPFSAVIKKDPFLVIPTAYLISETGLKGTRSGGAEISGKHPNFIINTGQATAKDVKTLISLAQEKVKEKFSIQIEPEVIEI